MMKIVDMIRDELLGVWRFRWIALTIAWSISILGWLFVYSMPDVYEAWSRVYVNTRTPLRPLLTGVAAEQDVESQIVMVRQALLGKPNLERVALDARLIDASATPQKRQSTIVGLAQRIKIDQEALPGRDARTPNTFYKISYQDNDREKAIEVVGLVLDAFVQDTFGTKREGAEAAEAFLVEQLKQYRERLSAAESALAEFKRSNIGMMPGAEGGYFDRLAHAERDVQRVEAALRVALSRKAELERQLSGETPFMPSTSPSAGIGGGAGQASADTASRIQETQARLDELLLRFTERHPDVIAAQQTLVELKARQAQEIEAIRRGGSGAGAGAATNPVYQNIQLQLHEANVQIVALRGELRDFKGNVTTLRHALDTAPEVEAEYTRLTRDYEVTQTQYNALLQRLEQARVSEKAQQTGIVDFQVLDPPIASYSPIFPARPLFLVLVVFAACGIGAGVAWVLSKLWPVFLHGRTLAEATGLPVIGVVSLAWAERHRAALKREHLRYVAVAGLLIVVTVVVTVVHEAGSRFVQQLMS
jgi:polysaccharide chain length determinant protein (PEP-CTERM system associated)